MPLPELQAPLTRLLSPRRRRGADGPGFALSPDDVQVLDGPAAFREHLMAAIAAAQRRILIVALYLEDDDAGREVLQALYRARAARPSLRVDVVVDWHRARRGRIGERKSAGNAAMYRDFAERCGEGVAIHGVPVHERELFGVLHLKGHVIDDTVIYSGASINDVYLARHGRYRVDRYWVFRQRGLADSLAGFVDAHLLRRPAVKRLDREATPPAMAWSASVRGLRQGLRRAHYERAHATHAPGTLTVTPLLGFGRRGNALNRTILRLIDHASERIVLLTPYFNLPKSVRRALGRAMRRGCTVEIMVGDKRANDFFIPPQQPFRKIGLLPYLYEMHLRRFVIAHRRHIDQGVLRVWSWCDGDNSFHVKGLLADDRELLLTGHNLNPRAWRLDLENGLWISDAERRLQPLWQHEWARLHQHARRIDEAASIDSPRQYPAEVRRLLKRLRRLRFDHLVKRLL